MFTGMTQKQAEVLAEVVVALGADEGRVVEHEDGWSVEVWLTGLREADYLVCTIDAARVKADT